MKSHRDSITIWQATREEGDDHAQHTAALITHCPCTVKQIAGDETWRRNQLREHVDFVVQMWHTERHQRITEEDMVEVTGGWQRGKTLNIRWVRFHDRTGSRPPMVELYCREGIA